MPDKKKTRQETIPEAVASVTYSLESPNGFPILFTVRGESGGELLTRMEKYIEPELVAMNFKPQVKSYGGGPRPPKPPPQVVPDRKCPLCGSDLHFGTTKDGRKFIKCSTQTYNFQTRQSEGCKHFEWANN